MAETAREDWDVLQTFVVALGAALTSVGDPAYSVQDRLTTRRACPMAPTRRGSVRFPTYMMVTMGPGAPATVEITVPLSSSPRLDQIAALDRLADQAERGRHRTGRRARPARRPSETCGPASVRL